MIIVHDYQHDRTYYPRKIKLNQLHNHVTEKPAFVVSFHSKPDHKLITIEFNEIILKDRNYIEINDEKYNYYDMLKNPELIMVIIEQENTRMAIEALP